MGQSQSAGAGRLLVVPKTGVVSREKKGRHEPNQAHAQPLAVSERGYSDMQGILPCFSLLPPATWARFCRAHYFTGMLGVIYNQEQ